MELSRVASAPEPKATEFTFCARANVPILTASSFASAFIPIAVAALEALVGVHLGFKISTPVKS